METLPQVQKRKWQPEESNMRLYDKIASLFSFSMEFYFEIMFKINGSEKEPTLHCNDIKKHIGGLINCSR